MRKVLLGLFLMLFSTPVFAEECAIKFGGGGKDSSWMKLQNSKVTRINNIGGPWSFIRETRGSCSFTVFNGNKFEGRRATYGTELSGRIRTGAKGAHDKGGWKTRSVVITPNRNRCSIVLMDGRGKVLGSVLQTQTFHGPSVINNITGWSYVKKTSGKCEFSLFNNSGLQGRLVKFETVRKQVQLDWRVRSIRITRR